MGHTYAYRCERCGYEEDFNHGYGYLVHSQPVREYLERRSKLFHYKTHQLIEQLARTKDNLFIKAGFQVYKCPKCKTLSDKIEVVVSNEEKVLHKSEFRCNQCRTRLKLTNIHRLNKATCPKCHNKTFKMDHEHPELWD